MARGRPQGYRPTSDRPRSDSYRPQQHQSRDTYRPAQNREYDTYRPGQDLDRDERRDVSSQKEVPNLPPVRSAVSKTKRERNTNPSTRIHSLKRLLQTQNLPGKVRQEKERELAALLFDQQKSQHAQVAKKNLQRYHFVRFMERKKAEKNLRQFQQRKDSKKYQDEASQNELEKLIHTAEVDVNYTKYAPLGDKYISLFPQDENDKKRDKMQMDKREFAVLNEQQQEEFRTLGDRFANVVRTATGTKPPMWYEVEKVMEKGEANLEALRDGKMTTGNQLKMDLATVGGKHDAQMRKANGRQLEEATPDWLDDDGVIDPADLDSGQDEEMSDGGFFER